MGFLSKMYKRRQKATEMSAMLASRGAERDAVASAAEDDGAVAANAPATYRRKEGAAPASTQGTIAAAFAKAATSACDDAAAPKSAAPDPFDFESSADFDVGPAVSIPPHLVGSHHRGDARDDDDGDDGGGGAFDGARAARPPSPADGLYNDPFKSARAHSHTPSKRRKVTWAEVEDFELGESSEDEEPAEWNLFGTPTRATAGKNARDARDAAEATPAWAKRAAAEHAARRAAAMDDAMDSDDRRGPGGDDSTSPGAAAARGAAAMDAAARGAGAKKAAARAAAAAAARPARAWPAAA